MIGLPFALPMGWKESPPCSCMTTETTADLANQAPQQSTVFAPHHSDDVSETPAPVSTTAATPSVATKCPPTDRDRLKSLLRQRIRDKQTAREPLRHWDVHVDNFVGLAQGNATQ